MPARTFTVSIASILPMIPAVAPKTPLASHVERKSSSMPGKTHSRHGVSGGAKTERLPSRPTAAPKTYGVLDLKHARLTRYLVFMLSKPSTTQFIPDNNFCTLRSFRFSGTGSVFTRGLMLCNFSAEISTLG
jgi:hypothetical protein